MSDTSVMTPVQPRRRKKHIVRRILLWLLLLLILASAGFYLYARLKSEYTVTYDSYTASRGSISNALSFSGSLQLVTSSTYNASSSATVRAVYVSEGDKVSSGDRLVRLSNGETVKAEFDGTVNTVSVKAGEDVSANKELIQVADFTHLKTSVRIDEYDIASVHVGDPVTVTATATEKTYSSTISSINYISSSQGNVAYYTGTVYIDVESGDSVYPGMQVTVTVPQEQAEDVVILKMDALSFTDNNTAFVYRLESDGTTMTEVPVTVGVSNGNYVEIRDGVNEGDEVFAIAKTDTTSSMASALSSLFGSQQINNRGNSTRNNRTNNSYSNGGGNMPRSNSPGSRGGN